jgi:hypothetical protein
VTRERLSAAISSLLEKNWAEEEPGERCFDHDEARMSRLVSYLAGRADREETNEVKDHLLECPRCRFIYARVRQTVTQPETPPDSEEAHGECVPAALRDHLRTAGPVVFPDGRVARGAWEFGQLGSLDAQANEEVIEVVAEQAWSKLRSLASKREVVLVCFSRPIHTCGKRLATKMMSGGVKDVHVVMADDYFTPKLWCDPEELRSRYVVVFVDVVHSASLLNRLYAACREACPSELTGLAVIDQSEGRLAPEQFCALWREKPEPRVPFDASRHARARFFDPASAVSRKREDLPQEVANPKTAQAMVEEHLAAIEPLRHYIEATGALRRDTKICGVHYPWAVDLLRLLRHDEARADLASRAAERLKDLRTQGAWCLVYPAERHMRAGAWAELLSTALRFPVVKIGLKARMHYRQLTDEQRQQLSRCPRALVVDAAIRTGKTLQSIVNLLRTAPNHPDYQVAAFYAFDGLFQESRTQLEKCLGTEIRSLFRLPLGAPTEPVDQYCGRRMSDTLRELPPAEATDPTGWVEVVRGYCRKKLWGSRCRSRKRGYAGIDQRMRLALEEGERGARARLEQSCDPPSASLVKHLDVSYALGDPRTRNVLHGFLCNSMPPDFIEWCALALATQKDYEWLDRDWLLLHRRLFTNAASPRWRFLACVSYWIRQQGDEELIRRVRQAIEEFRRSEPAQQRPLVQDLFADFEPKESVDSRCDTLISILSNS